MVQISADADADAGVATVSVAQAAAETRREVTKFLNVRMDSSFTTGIVRIASAVRRSPDPQSRRKKEPWTARRPLRVRVAFLPVRARQEGPGPGTGDIERRGPCICYTCEVAVIPRCGGLGYGLLAGEQGPAWVCRER
ncbi:hypothetical protein GCM10009677_33130 [Sphaerisporangium rubeum]